MKLFFLGGAARVVAVAACVGSCAPLAQAYSAVDQGSWVSTLQGRDLDGSWSNGFEAYYDTVLDITWLADPNYAKTSGYTRNGADDFVSAYGSHLTWKNGRMGWAAAMTWVRNLNVGGVTGWRLPTMVDTSSAGCNHAYGGTDCGYNVATQTSELAHLFHVTLGNKSVYDLAGTVQSNGGVGNVGPFSSNTVVIGSYWFGVEYSPYAPYAWEFNIGLGRQFMSGKDSPAFAWAVHSGDVGVTAVPEPESFVMALAGMAVIGFIVRRSRPV